MSPRVAKKSRPTSYASHQLLELLRCRHSDDVFIPECKDGPSQGGSHLRLDAWAMKKSWANECSYGYEIKVTRSDFQRDDKWHCYLPYCNQLYIVTPPGLVKPEELPADVGLVICTPKATKLYTLKPATHRAVQIPREFWMYVVMRLSGWHSRPQQTREERIAEWRVKLDTARTAVDLGYQISSKIDRFVRDAEREATRAKELVAKYERLQSVLDTMGITADELRHMYDPAQRIKDLTAKVPPDFLSKVERFERMASNVEHAAAQVRKALNGEKHEDDEDA